MSFHIFNIEIATKYGMAAAVILQNIEYWIDKNEANEKHFYDGKYWTYNSVTAFSKLFPYLTDKQIRTALKTLEDNGLIETGSYNKSPYDRTKWYTKGQKSPQTTQSPICPTGKLDCPKKANQFALQGRPIPNIKPNSKPNNIIAQQREVSDTNISNTTTHRTNADISSQQIEVAFSNIWKLYPRKLGKSKVSKARKKKLYEYGEDNVIKAINKYKDYIAMQRLEERFIQHGSTFFNGGIEDYIVDNIVETVEKGEKE